MNKKSPFLMLALLSALSACSDDADTLTPATDDAGVVETGDTSPLNEGLVIVAAYGEEFVEQNLNTDDSWNVTFDRFETNIASVTMNGVTVTTTSAVELTNDSQGIGHTIGQIVLQEGDYTGSSFVITQMSVSGSATKNNVTKSFSWTFNQTTNYTACEATTEVRLGSPTRFQVTVHADHLFYDSLVADEPGVVFQPLADADSDLNGEISRAELEATDIGAFDPGSSGNVDNLWEWLIAQSQTVGHVNGETHCVSQPQ